MRCEVSLATCWWSCAIILAETRKKVNGAGSSTLSGNGAAKIGLRLECIVPDRPARVKFIKWDANVCLPNDRVNAATSTPALDRFVDDIAHVLGSGGIVLTTVPLSEPGTAAIVALVYDD